MLKNLHFEINKTNSDNKVSINHIHTWVRECVKAGKSIDNVLETIRTMYYNELMKESQLNKVNSMVPRPVNVAVTATFTGHFGLIFRFCCRYGNIY